MFYSKTLKFTNEEFQIITTYRKVLYQIIEKLINVTNELIDHNKKQFTNKNNLLLYHPKDYALRELLQLHSFTELHIVDAKTDTDNPSEAPHFNNLPIPTNLTQNEKPGK